jgi:DNA-binding CsgD family transcriptional regulator|uniref:response regulator transcription factor n=1 Tax=Altererythrobacter segetis TaxID=1104773 RepID=UPI00140AC57F|nr:helix-turn-helix transcriptional regulator [Altererythrobacter segetis]
MMASRSPAEAMADECRVEFAAAFEAFDPRPKIVVDYDQCVLWCCDDAPRLLDGPMPLCIRKGKLIVDDDELRSEFVEFLHNVGPDVQRKLIRGKAKRHWAVLRAWKPAHWDRAVCVLASPSLPLRDIVACGLAAELKLTNAEIRVLKEFAELNSPKQIARDLGVSLSTVRSHLKQIHAKASVTTSLQLLRLTHTFCSG